MMTITPPVDTSVDHFETVYAEADGDATRIPWADLEPNPALVTWLNAVAPSLIRCGGRVAVVGCGLGDDARELMRRGYDVVAFDCSPTAVHWAKELDPVNASAYHVADLFDLPSRWQHRFDLVVEINTLQSLLPEQRGDAIKPMANLLSRHGHLLVICRHADEPVDINEGPPWAVTTKELSEAATDAGLVAIGDITVFKDGQVPPISRMRALFTRAE